jgi:hypothetical protein
LAFNEKYNSDDVIHRNIIIGLLNLLNRRIVYNQVVGPDEVKEISVPFFYFMYNDERFMQDFYQLNGLECDGPQYVEGNIDPIPRGVINMSSMTVNSAALTSKFVRGTFNKEVDGTLKAYSAYLNPIPLTLIFDVEIICNTFTESLKIIQQTIDTFYKVAIFAIDYRGLRVPCQVGFSQDYNIEKPITFSYGEENKITMKFTLEMETYQPVFDKPSERFRGNIMDHGIGNEIFSVSGLSGHSGIDYIAKLSVETNPSLTDEQDSQNPQPDIKAPYGYDIDGNPIKP